MITIVLAGMEGSALGHLRRMFESTDGIEIAGHVTLAPDAAAYAQRKGATVLAIYLAASTGDTFDVVKRIRSAAPSLRLLGLGRRIARSRSAESASRFVDASQSERWSAS